MKIPLDLGGFGPLKTLIFAAVTAAMLTLPIGKALRPGQADASAIQAAGKCQNTQLTVGIQTSQGAAGHIAVIYRFHNLTGTACTLSGYPGVQLLDRHFLSLPTTVHRSPGNLVGPIPKQLVAVGAHGNAYFALGYSDVPVNNQPCSTAYYLMVFAPNDVLPVVTYASHGGGITACTGNINVSPVTAQPRFQ